MIRKFSLSVHRVSVSKWIHVLINGYLETCEKSWTQTIQFNIKMWRLYLP